MEEFVYLEGGTLIKLLEEVVYGGRYYGEDSFYVGGYA